MFQTAKETGKADFLFYLPPDTMQSPDTRRVDLLEIARGYYGAQHGEDNRYMTLASRVGEVLFEHKVPLHTIVPEDFGHPGLVADVYRIKGLDKKTAQDLAESFKTFGQYPLGGRPLSSQIELEYAPDVAPVHVRQNPTKPTPPSPGSPPHAKP